MLLIAVVLLVLSLFPSYFFLSPEKPSASSLPTYIPPSSPPPSTGGVKETVEQAIVTACQTIVSEMIKNSCGDASTMRVWSFLRQGTAYEGELGSVLNPTPTGFLCADDGASFGRYLLYKSVGYLTARYRITYRIEDNGSTDKCGIADFVSVSPLP